MIVVDTNVVVYYVLTTPQTQVARQIRDADSDWHVPSFWLSEFRDAMSEYIRSGELTLRGALDAMDFAKRKLADKEHKVDSVRVMELVANSACSAYDCEYVALALQLGVPLVTADRRILREFPDVAVSPDAFALGAG